MRIAYACLPVLAAIILGCSSGVEAPKTAAQGKSDFAETQRILTANCAGCHGNAGAKDGVVLTSHASIMKGGNHGPIVTAGAPDTSTLVDVLRKRNGKKQMPPSGPLSEQDIASIEAWISAGAKEG